jgi:protein TonB
MGEILPPAVRPPPALPGDPFADRGEVRRWAGALAMVLAVHALPALVAAYWLGPQASTPAPEPAIFIDLPPPAAPPEPPSERPPGPKEEKVETPPPKIERRIETPAPNPEVAIPVPPPEPPRPVVETTAPPVMPLPPAPRLSSGQPTWEGQVLGRLNQFKRYPSAAQRLRQQGVPYIRFVMDREGKVVSSRLERSSGFRSLDDEAVALPKRAQPLPKPPEDVGGQTLELVVPVEFFIR